jgi:hypothetical protein
VVLTQVLLAILREQFSTLSPGKPPRLRVHRSSQGEDVECPGRPVQRLRPQRSIVSIAPPAHFSDSLANSD